MRKVYKYLVSYIGEKKDNNGTMYGNAYVEYGSPLETQSQIEMLRKDINQKCNLIDCSIFFIKRLKVERIDIDN